MSDLVIPAEVEPSNEVLFLLLSSFPSWLQGSWEDLRVSQSSLEHMDQANLRKITSQCIQNSSSHPNRFLIYSRSQCGDEQYNCVWFEPRGVNIVEYQMGRRPSTTPSDSLCDNDHFLQRTWNTRASKI